ncbi:MAG: porin family protein [Myxococcales bacterium]|nr:porin family protein [Myxococcales bacterium]
MSQKKTVLTVIAASGLCVALAAEAHADRYQVSLGGGSSALPSESIDALGDAKSYARADLEVGVELRHVPILGTTEIALAWDTGGFSGTSFGRIDSDLSLDTVMVLARVRRDIRPRLTGFGEFGMGVQWGNLKLNDAGSELARRLEDSDKAAASTIGAGVDFQLTNIASSLKLGVRAKVNYRVISSHDFSATPKMGGSDELVLSTSSADLGSVNTSGLAFGAALVGRF